MDSNHPFSINGGTYGGTSGDALWEQRMYNLLHDHLHGSSQQTGAAGAGNSTNIHQAGTNPAGTSAGAYQSAANVGADSSASDNPPRPKGPGYHNDTAHNYGQMGAASSTYSLAATLQRANASRAVSSGPTQPEVSSPSIDPTLLTRDRNLAASPAALNSGMPQDVAPGFPAGGLIFGQDANFGQDAPAPASPRPAASRTSGAAELSANRQANGRRKVASRGVGRRDQPILAQGRANAPQAQPAPAQESKPMCKNGATPLLNADKPGNLQGACQYWNQALRHHHSRCDYLKPDGCIANCEFQKKFPLTCAKWSQQRFQVKWDVTELPAHPETEILSGFAVEAKKLHGFKVIGELLADGKINKKSKTVHRVDNPPKQ